MTRFTFRLQSVLDLRIAERDRRSGQLAAALRAEQIVDNQIKAAQKTVQQTRRSLRKYTQPGAVEVSQILDLQRYEMIMTAQIEQMRDQLRQIHEEVTRRRAALVEAGRDVRVLEKLRDRRLREHVTRQQHRDQREMDEIATRGAHRHARVKLT